MPENTIYIDDETMEVYKTYELNKSKKTSSIKGRRENANFKRLIDKDESLQTAIANETNTRVHDIELEREQRIAADNSLASQIAAEVTARIGGDNSLASQISDEVTARIGGDDSLASQISDEVTARMGGDGALQGQINVAHQRIDGIELLGQYVGSFATKAALPTSVSSFPNGITVNDFTTIRADETNAGSPCRYVVQNISGAGVITWKFDLAYQSDVSGKADNNQTVPADTAEAGVKLTLPNTASVAAWLKWIVSRVHWLITNIATKANDSQTVAGLESNLILLTADTQPLNLWILRFCNRINGLINALAARVSKGTGKINASNGSGGWNDTKWTITNDEIQNSITQSESPDNYYYSITANRESLTATKGHTGSTTSSSFSKVSAGNITLHSQAVSSSGSVSRDTIITSNSITIDGAAVLTRADMFNVWYAEGVNSADKYVRFNIGVDATQLHETIMFKALLSIAHWDIQIARLMELSGTFRGDLGHVTRTLLNAGLLPVKMYRVSSTAYIVEVELPFSPAEPYIASCEIRQPRKLYANDAQRITSVSVTTSSSAVSSYQNVATL